MTQITIPFSAENFNSRYDLLGQVAARASLKELLSGKRLDTKITDSTMGRCLGNASVYCDENLASGGNVRTQSNSRSGDGSDDDMSGYEGHPLIQLGRVEYDEDAWIHYLSHKWSQPDAPVDYTEVLQGLLDLKKIVKRTCLFEIERTDLVVKYNLLWPKTKNQHCQTSSDSNTERQHSKEAAVNVDAGKDLQIAAVKREPMETTTQDGESESLDILQSSTPENEETSDASDLVIQTNPAVEKRAHPVESSTLRAPLPSRPGTPPSTPGEPVLTGSVTGVQVKREPEGVNPDANTVLVLDHNRNVTKTNPFDDESDEVQFVAVKHGNGKRKRTSESAASVENSVSIQSDETPIVKQQPNDECLGDSVDSETHQNSRATDFDSNSLVSSSLSGSVATSCNKKRRTESVILPLASKQRKSAVTTSQTDSTSVAQHPPIPVALKLNPIECGVAKNVFSYQLHSERVSEALPNPVKTTLPLKNGQRCSKSQDLLWTMDPKTPKLVPHNVFLQHSMVKVNLRIARYVPEISDCLLFLFKAKPLSVQLCLKVDQSSCEKRIRIPISETHCLMLNMNEVLNEADLFPGVSIVRTDNLKIRRMSMGRESLPSSDSSVLSLASCPGSSSRSLPLDAPLSSSSSDDSTLVSLASETNERFLARKSLHRPKSTDQVRQRYKPDCSDPAGGTLQTGNCRSNSKSPVRSQKSVTNQSGTGKRGSSNVVQPADENYFRIANSFALSELSNPAIAGCDTVPIEKHVEMGCLNCEEKSHGFEFRCKFCTEHFICARALRFHLFNEHNRLVCVVCGRKFPQKLLLQQHVLLSHSGT